MHRESQVVLVVSEGVYGIITEVHSYMCKVQYSVDGIEFHEYFENDDLEVIGEIGYEEE
ncbi:hypothetical protein HWB80_gp085 [Streptomyces phage Karimac]|uniref:Uncharacterized protein n=1 Tax=Streptomyces phage Karimac TaxID=2283303 RepID=A0A345MHM3_9CAUD|nr:hypothetical protein HWB80_gp085 [Streptomyces phage Karimac]AXH70054.1 hypothetical protein SEA_KARIMAC_237 [Streptomyces phage Karimac]